MCGRYSQSQPAEIIAKAFHLDDVPTLEPRYNIAPTQFVSAIGQDSKSSDRQLKLFQWGLIPSWAKDKTIGSKLINARAETVAEKPSFRSAFKQRRCLILADGFYEWQKQEKKKQPYYFRMAEKEPFAFAGLWEHWEGEEGVIESCTILTTEPNELMSSVHNRMPVILESKDYDLWLDPDAKKPLLQPLLKPFSPEAMTAYPVSTQVNKPINDSPELINSL